MKTFCFFYLAAIWMVDGASAQSVVPWGGGALARDVASIKHFFAGGTYALAMVKKQPPRRWVPTAARRRRARARHSLQRLVHHRLPKDVAVLGLGDGVRGLPVAVDRAWIGTSLEQDFEYGG